MANATGKMIQSYDNGHGYAIKLGDVAKIKHKFSGIGDFFMACKKESEGVATEAMKHWNRTCEILKVK